MNKNEFIKAVAEKADMTQVDAGKCYEAVVATITEALKAGDKVSLLGFGNFEAKTRAARIGVNPKTGAKIDIAAAKTVSFKAGKAMKDSI